MARIKLILDLDFSTCTRLGYNLGLFNIQDKFGLIDRKPEARPNLLAHVYGLIYSKQVIQTSEE